MTETPGVVVRTETNFAYVEIGARMAGCGRCHEPGGCGSTLGGGSRTSAKRTYKLNNEIGARVGDDVALTVPEGALFKATIFAYLVPILLAIGGAGFGTAISDAAAIVGASAGLVIGLLPLRYVQMKLLGSREPLLTMRIKSCAFNLQKEHPVC